MPEAVTSVTVDVAMSYVKRLPLPSVTSPVGRSELPSVVAVAPEPSYTRAVPVAVPVMGKSATVDVPEGTAASVAVCVPGDNGAKVTGTVQSSVLSA